MRWNTQKKRISSPDFRNCKHIGTFFSAICKKESILQKVEAKLQQYEAKKLKIENDLKYMKTKFKESKYSQRLSDYDNSHYPDMIPSESRVQDIGAADSGIEIDTENLLASLNSSYLPPTFQALGVIQKHRHTKRLRSCQQVVLCQNVMAQEKPVNQKEDQFMNIVKNNYGKKQTFQVFLKLM